MSNPLYMATVSNKIIDLNDFKESDVKLNDIAIVLDHINRYNGHVITSYTVLQHSLLVGLLFLEHYSDKFSFDNVMACFLHDAAEVYIGDVISPMKVTPEFDFFRDMDLRISGIIYRAFNMDESKVDWDIVKLCDKQACYIEMCHFFPHIPVNFVQSSFDVDLQDYNVEDFNESTEDYIEAIKMAYKKFDKTIPETIFED